MEGLTVFPGNTFLSEEYWKNNFQHLESNHESRSPDDQAEGNSFFHKARPYHWYLGQTWSGIFHAKITEHEDKYSLIGSKKYHFRDVFYYQKHSLLQIYSEIEFVILKSVVCPFMSFDNWNQSMCFDSMDPLKKKVDISFYETNLEYRQAEYERRRQSNMSSDSCAFECSQQEQEQEPDVLTEDDDSFFNLGSYHQFVLQTQNFKLFAEVILDYNRKHRRQLDTLFQNLKSQLVKYEPEQIDQLYEISSRHRLYFNTDLPIYIFVMKMLDYVAFKYYVAISNNYTTPDFERVYYDLVNEFMTLSCDESVALVDSLYFVLDNYNFVYSEMGCIDDTYYDDTIYDNQTKYLYPFCQDNDLRNQVFEFVGFLLQQ